MVLQYITICEILFFIFFAISNFTSKEKLVDLLDSPINMVRLAMIILIFIFIMLSYKKSMKYTAWAFLPLQALQMINLNDASNIMALEDEDTRNYELISGIVMFQFGIFNTFLFVELVNKYSTILITASVIINYISLFWKLFGGFDGYYLQIGFILFITMSFSITKSLLKNLNDNLIVRISKKQANQLSSINDLKEFETLYQNIDLGIMVVKNGVVDYANELF